MLILAGIKPYNMAEKTVHQGRAVKRLREILGIKQEELATGLGITQQSISSLEGREVIDQKILEDVAKILKVPVDAITHFNEDAAISIVASTLHDNAGSIFYNPTFNPIDKVVELYERMLKEKDEKIALLEKILSGKK